MFFLESVKMRFSSVRSTNEFFKFRSEEKPRYKGVNIFLLFQKQKRYQTIFRFATLMTDPQHAFARRNSKHLSSRECPLSCFFVVGQASSNSDTQQTSQRFCFFFLNRRDYVRFLAGLFSSLADKHFAHVKEVWLSLPLFFCCWQFFFRFIFLTTPSHHRPLWRRGSP